MTTNTPKLSLPYPDPTDPVAYTDDAIKNLATAIDGVALRTGSDTVSGAALAAGGLLTVNLTHGLGYTPGSAFAQITGFVTNSSPIVLKGVTAISSTTLTVTLLNSSGSAATWTALPVRWWTRG